jgi:hypothetical protein
MANETSQSVNLSLGVEDSRVDTLKSFLERFGYFSIEIRNIARMERAERNTFDLATHLALQKYQRFHGLPETGTLDEATAYMMSQPRCGLPDSADYVIEGRRWNTKNLSYSIENTPPNLGMDQVKSAVRQAFGYWSSVTPLRFSEVPINQSHDIHIRFASRAHGDDSPFDGPGRTLAHAFYPPPNGGDLAGDAHCDLDESWEIRLPLPSGYFDLVTVAAHEFGHSLGLAHSQDAGALMFPTYTGPHRFLSADDVAGIRAIYGSGFLLQTGTPLHETDQTFAFALASNQDLFAIKKSRTGSNSTEVHVLSAASNYQQFVLQTKTALHETDNTFEFAVASNRDLVAIKKSSTGSNKTEVHILSAASNYQQFSLQTGTALHQTDQTFEFAIAQNRDLFAIKKSGTGTNSTEVHILSAGSNYQQFALQTGTVLHQTDQTFEFALAQNRDLFAVKKSRTSTNSSEVHVLAAAGNYQRFILQTGTSLHETDETFTFDVTRSRELFAVKKSRTGTRSTEVHIVDLP